MLSLHSGGGIFSISNVWNSPSLPPFLPPSLLPGWSSEVTPQFRWEGKRAENVQGLPQRKRSCTAGRTWRISPWSSTCADVWKSWYTCSCYEPPTLCFVQGYREELRDSEREKLKLKTRLREDIENQRLGNSLLPSSLPSSSTYFVLPSPPLSQEPEWSSRVSAWPSYEEAGGGGDGL